MDTLAGAGDPRGSRQVERKRVPSTNTTLVLSSVAHKALVLVLDR